MGLPLKSLCSMGVGAVGLAMVGSGLSIPSLLQATAAVAQSVLTELFAGHYIEHRDAPADSPESLIRNHDLRMLVGISIQRTILLERHNGTDVELLAAGALDAWMTEWAAARWDHAPLSEGRVPEMFCSSEIEFDKQRALSVPVWELFLDALSARAGVALNNGVRLRIATTLHERLPSMLRATVKADFSGDTVAEGRGFASLHLVMMGRLMEGMQRLLDQPTTRLESEGELLKELREFNRRMEEPAARHAKRISDPRELRALRDTLSQIRTLRSHLDARLDQLARVVADEGARTRAEVRGVRRHTRLILPLGVLGCLLFAAAIALVARRGGFAAPMETGQLDAALAAHAIDPQAERVIVPALTPEQDRYARMALERGTVMQQLKGAIATGDFALADQLQHRLEQMGRSDHDAETHELLSLEGTRWLRAGNSDAAVAPFEAALALKPDDAASMQNVIAARGTARLGDLEEHCRRCIELGESCLAAIPIGTTDWINAQLNLGVAWQRLPTGNKGDNLQRAIAAFEAAGQATPRYSNPMLWARSLYNLACATLQLPGGDLAGHCRRSMEFAEEAARVFTRQDAPADWARLQWLLANAWYSLPGGDRGANLNRALEGYARAQEVFTRESFPAEWSQLQRNLATTWGSMPADDLQARARGSIDACTEALAVTSRVEDPRNWARLQRALGSALLDVRAVGEGASVRRALECFEAAEQVLPREQDRIEWIQLQHLKAAAWWRIQDAERPARLRMALEVCQAALNATDRAADPRTWALCQSALGRAWFALNEYEPTIAMEQARACSTAALTVFTTDAHPREWTREQLQLARLLLATELGSGHENALAAIRECELAKRADTAALTAYDRAEAARVLGDAYGRLSASGSVSMSLRALECYREACEIWTPQAYPLEWARMQRAIAGAMRDANPGQPEGRADIIHLLTASLEYLDRSAFPRDWADTHYALGLTWADDLRVDRQEAQANAIQAFREALNSVTRDSAPNLWVRINIGLGSALSLDARGDRVSTLEVAIQHFRSAMTVASHESSPKTWAFAAHGLGSALAILSEQPGQPTCELLRQAIALEKAALEIRTEAEHAVEYRQTAYALSEDRAAYNGLGCGDEAPFESISPTR